MSLRNHHRQSLPTLAHAVPLDATESEVGTDSPHTAAGYLTKAGFGGSAAHTVLLPDISQAGAVTAFPHVEPLAAAAYRAGGRGRCGVLRAVFQTHCALRCDFRFPQFAFAWPFPFQLFACGQQPGAQYRGDGYPE